MRAEEILLESRGVTARLPGETYVADGNPSDILTIQSIDVLPSEGQGSAYESSEDMLAALDAALPQGAVKIEDNATNTGTKAVLIATVKRESDGQIQHHVRYIKGIPPTGIHTLWKTIKGYKFSKGAEQESVPIKPSDLIKDENYRSAEQLANDVVTGTKKLVQGTGHDELAVVMEQAVKNALAGTSSPIPNAGQYFNVLQKYAGEYLGPIALMSNPNTVGGDTSEIMKAFEVNNFAGSGCSFPQNVSMELIDSVIKLAQGPEIQVSSKISTSGGAASSLSGVYKQMTPKISAEYPAGSEIIQILATESSVNGPLKVALKLGIIDQADIQALSDLDKASKNIADLKTQRMQELTQSQGVAKGTLDRPDYRVFYHALTAVMNRVIPQVNQSDEFKAAMLAVLNNNQYVQLVTKGKQDNKGNVTMEYYTKFPAVYAGAPALVNKTYFATGQKGRIGFKLK